MLRLAAQSWETMAYGSPISRKTTYSYDDAGRGNLQKGNRAKLPAHLKHSPVAKTERGRGNKVFDGKAAYG